MAVDPQLQSQLEQLERENRLLDERLAAQRKAAAEAKPRSLGQRFVDNLVDAFQRNPSVASYRNALTNPAANLPGQVDVFSLAGPAAGLARGAVTALGGLLPEHGRGWVEAEEKRRQDYAAKAADDPFYKAPGGLPGKVAAAVATAGGQLGGSLADPVNLAVPEVKGAGIAKAATRAAAQGLLNAGADVAAQNADVSAGLSQKFNVEEALASGAAGVGIAATFEGGRALVNLFKRRIPTDGGKPPLSEKEVPASDNPRALEPAPESPAHVPPPEPAEKPAGASQAKPATSLPEGVRKSAQDSAGGPSGAPEGDPWSFVDWGKMRSPERAKAAVEHLDFLKKYIRPEAVKDFVNALDRPEVAGQLGGGERIGSINPKYVDWDKLDASPEDILQWANIRAAIFKDAFDKAGDAPKTWDQIDRTSRLLGKDLSTLIKTHADITGEGGIAARVGALQQVTLEAADAFHAQLKDTRARIEAGDMSGVQDFAAATQRLVLLESMAEGSVSEIARALNYMKRLKTPKAAFNDLQSVMDEFADAMNGGKPVDPDSMKRAMDNLDKAFRKRGAAGVREEVSKMRQLGLTDYVGYVVVGGMLSAPKTWIRNLMGTPIMEAFQIAERYVGATVGSARGALGIGSKERMTFAEANAYVAASIDALHEGFGAAWKAFKTGASESGTSITGEGATRPIPFQFTRERFDGWVKDGFKARTALDVAGTAFYEVVRSFGYRPSVAADEFYKVIARRQQLAGLAYREAFYRASQAPEADRANVFRSTLDDIRQQPTAQAFKEAKGWFLDNDLDPDAVYPEGSKAEELARLIRSVDLEKLAADHARLMTFQSSGPAIHKWEQALATVPLVKWFYVPFFKTPINLVKAGIIDRNPATLGLLGDNRRAFARLIETAKTDDAALQRGGAEADLAMARLLTGTAFMSFAFGLWLNGHLVGRRGEPGDPTKQDGVLDYSLKLPGGEWVQYSSLDPILGSNLGLVADLAQTLKDRPLEDNVAEALVGGVSAAIRNNILNKASLSGLKSFYETWYGSGQATDKAGGSAVVEGLSSTGENLVPLSSLLRSAAQDIDPVRRDARGLIDHIKSVIPTWSQELPARRDAFGRPLVRPAGQRGEFQALNTSHLTDDPLDLEQSRLAAALPDFTLKPAQRRFNGQPVTSKEYSRVLEVQGQLYRDPHTGLNMEQAALDLIASEDYAAWSDERRSQELKDTVTRYREAANEAIRDPRSEFYMPEMVKRTGTAQITAEAPAKGLAGGRLRRRAKALGLQPEDLDALEAIFNTN